MKSEKTNRKIRIQPFDKNDLKIMKNLKNMPRFEIKINFLCPIFKLKEMLRDKWFKKNNIDEENYSLELFIDERCNYKNCGSFMEGIQEHLMVKDLYENFNLKFNEVIWMLYKIKVNTKFLSQNNKSRYKNYITINNIYNKTNNNYIPFNDNNNNVLDKSINSFNSFKIENSYFPSQNKTNYLFNSNLLYKSNNFNSFNVNQNILDFENIKSKKSTEFIMKEKEEKSKNTNKNINSFKEGLDLLSLKFK